jgi:glycosyltransferase involved in cell wall biosynthesis
MIVGSFPAPNYSVFGGISASCGALVAAKIGGHLELVLVDSTARSIPGPPIWIRALDSLPRSIKFVIKLLTKRPRYVLIFASAGFSFVEKSLYGMMARALGSIVMFSPRGGAIVEQFRRNWLLRIYATIAMRAPHYLLCQGPSWQSFLVQEVGVPEQRCHIVPNWTATHEALQIGRDRKSVPQSTIRIVFLGWLDKTKGVLELLRAFSALRQEFPGLQLLLGGEGDCSEFLRDFIHDNGMQGSIRLLGWVKGEQKLDLLRAGTIFCLPSHFEGLPNAMIEAMASGMPVVVTPVGAIPSVVDPGENGLFTPVGDEYALRENLRKLITDQPVRERLGSAAHDYAYQNLSADKAVKRIRKIFGY